ncbi:ABC transporter permease subunit [Candidatus Dojkabacteria bacterium]|nr:ABC transporter permease subunit [Candidatus Dojkabacteria bacterium]
MPKINIKKPNLKIHKVFFSNLNSLIFKELKSYFNSPIVYIVAFVGIIFHFFFFLFLGAFFQNGVSDLTTYFESLPWIFLLMVPAFTMGSISKEINQGTDEYILTKPVKTIEFVLAKVVAAFSFILITLLFELPAVITIITAGDFDIGKLFTQYLAVIFVAFCLTTVGVFYSSVVKNQIGSLLLTLLSNFIILFIGSRVVTFVLPLFLAPYIERISLITHFESMLKGVIDLQDLIYFTGFALFFITLIYYKISTIRLPKKSIKLTKLRFTTLLLLVIIFFITGFGQKIPGSIDLTRNKINTLSEVSKDISKNLDEKTTIQLYYSESLPAGLQTIKRDTISLLNDFKKAGNDKIRIVHKIGDTTKAMDKGIRVEKQGSGNLSTLQISDVYLGLVIKYKDQEETIASISNTNNLEYEITSTLTKLSNKDKKVIGILDTKVRNTSTTGLTAFKSTLEREYTVESIIFDEEQRTIDSEKFDAIIISAPNQEMSEEMQGEIRRYFDEGGALFFMVDPINVQTQMMFSASSVESPLNNFFEDLGITVEKTLLFDLKSYASLQHPNYVFGIPYPFFTITANTGENNSFNNISSVMLGWASWIRIDEEKVHNIEITPILQTSNFAGFQKEGEFNIEMEQTWDNIKENELDQYTVAVSFVEQDDSPGRAVLVSDSDFLTNQYGHLESYQNSAFGLTSIEWLVQNEALSSIKGKSRQIAPLMVKSPAHALFLNIMMFSPFALILLIAAGKFILRKREMKKVYK